MVTYLLLRRVAEEKPEVLQADSAGKKKWNLILTDPYSHQGGFIAH